MDMSKAALPARYGRASDQDEKHPLFPIYRNYRSSLSTQLVDCEDFSDWLYSYERNLENEAHAKHKQYPEFIEWMKINQGGARKCPAGVFPHNFQFWLNGGRW